MIDELVDRRSCFDHQHDLARLFYRRDKLFKRVTSDDLLVPRSTVDEIVHLRDRTIETSDGETLAFHVQDEVLTHDRQPDYTDIRIRHDCALL